MSPYSAAEEMDRLQLSDEDTEDLWDSPSKRGKKKTNQAPIKHESSPPAAAQSDLDEGTLFDRQEAREAALRNELQSVRNINHVIESLLGSLDRAKGNMDVRQFRYSFPGKQSTDSNLECLTNCQLRFYPSQHLDAHTIPNGA